jgi:hypothetical protein
MADITPAQLFDGYEYLTAGTEVTANSIVIPLSALFGELTAEEADPATGDGREVLRQIVGSAVKSIAVIPVEDRPTKLGIQTPALTALSATQVRKTYTFTFDLAVDSENLSIVAEA